VHLTCKSHNQFPSDALFPQINLLSNEFQDLCAIIAKYDVQNYFRLRLLHRHMPIPEGQILLSHIITEPFGYWAKPTSILDVNLQNIHGYIFSVDTFNSARNTLFPSEFRTGPPINLGNISNEFFTEFIDYLQRKGLEHILGLEVTQHRIEKMIEFSFHSGNILLHEDCVRMKLGKQKEEFVLQETGWKITIQKGIVCRTGETRCATFLTGHVRITDSKLENIFNIVEFLKNEEVLDI